VLTATLQTKTAMVAAFPSSVAGTPAIVAAGDEAAAAVASDRLMDYAERLTRDTILRKF
jgi:hypothetical protein